MNQLIGIGALIDNAWEHYRTHYKSLLKISVWLLVISVINVVAILLYPIDITAATATTFSEKIGIILLLINNLVFAVIVGTWMLNALIKAIHTQSTGTKLSYKKLNAGSWKLFLPQLFVRFLCLLFIVVSLLLPVLLFWFLTNVGVTFLPSLVLFPLLFAALLLLLPPVALVIYLAFSVFAVVEDGAHGLAALRASIVVVKKRFWPVALRMLIPKLLYFGVFFLLQYFLMIIIRVIGYSVLQGTDVLSAARVEWIALTLSYSVLFVFLNPILLITDHLLFSHLKKS
ncbi:hypothetical protein COV06_02315 [Candidatus Uhrbacteria bacterium CG10_big_fil_rev_8_21_14_0_10_50_16]|uniref:Glycerophosphoryl diester phosphodiesterase membrane domain-containing protein n=1 Tax=Candidatus Uhrbacteria bacterium CG10_big_fil_rev_8_21_14_0_10_50_16 TaxID=1975039 RepID=A0A2H0RPD2_9BACT|nr:MAG: hypothetical protein COV06_02315 [Candidatus Uhrbacteria bacterium CG10_big_fil_rev_8_21_14_0_10_50_16]